MSMPKKLDLECYRGQSWSQNLYFTRNKSPINLSGITARAQIRPAENADALAAEMVCTVSAYEGKISLYLPASITADMLPKTYLYDLKCVDKSGSVTYYVYGKFVVKGRVTV